MKVDLWFPATFSNGAGRVLAICSPPFDLIDAPLVHGLMMGVLPTLGEICKDKPAGIRGGLVHVQPELQNSSQDLSHLQCLVGPIFSCVLYSTKVHPR